MTLTPPLSSPSLPQWFAESPKVNTELKHAADMAFAEGDFAKAEQLYHKALEETSKRSMGSRRDIMEGISRSLLKRGMLPEALEWAQTLVTSKL